MTPERHTGDSSPQTSTWEAINRGCLNLRLAILVVGGTIVGLYKLVGPSRADGAAMLAIVTIALMVGLIIRRRGSLKKRRTRTSVPPQR